MLAKESKPVLNPSKLNLYCCDLLADQPARFADMSFTPKLTSKDESTSR